MAKTGRPRMYASKAEKDKAYRAAQKEAGYKGVRVDLAAEDKAMLDRFCRETGQKLKEAIPFLLYFYYEERRKAEENQEIK